MCLRFVDLCRIYFKEINNKNKVCNYYNNLTDYFARYDHGK